MSSTWSGVPRHVAPAPEGQRPLLQLYCAMLLQDEATGLGSSFHAKEHHVAHVCNPMPPLWL
jgi:hypothetical protein